MKTGVHDLPFSTLLVLICLLAARNIHVLPNSIGGLWFRGRCWRQETVAASFEIWVGLGKRPDAFDLTQ